MSDGYVMSPQVEAVAVIGSRWIDWMGDPPRPITNWFGAAAEAVDALCDHPDLLIRLLEELGVVIAPRTASGSES